MLHKNNNGLTNNIFYLKPLIIAGIPGNKSTSIITPVKTKNKTNEITQRFILESSLLRSLQKIKDKLSSSIVNDQPNAGFTNAKENTIMAADYLILPCCVISMPASSNVINTPTISAAHNTGCQIARTIASPIYWQ